MATKINVWQARGLAEAMEAVDSKRTSDDDSLATAYADIELTEVEGERILRVKFESGQYVALFHDGSNVTDEYPEEA